MKSDKRRRRMSPASPRGMNLHERMLDARARRAETLAHKDPSICNARPTPQHLRVAPARDLQSEITGAARFPAIVMPDAPPTSTNDDILRRHSAKLLPTLGLLLVLLFCAIYAVREYADDGPVLSAAKPAAADQLPNVSTH